jgi:hypothetical protein
VAQVCFLTTNNNLIYLKNTRPKIVNEKGHGNGQKAIEDRDHLQTQGRLAFTQGCVDKKKDLFYTKNHLPEFRHCQAQMLIFLQGTWHKPSYFLSLIN